MENDNLKNEKQCDIHDVVNFFDCEQEALRLEQKDFLQRCGSCLNFAAFMAEAGFCKIEKCNCLCKNPKAMIDMWNDKCDKWVANPNCL